MQKEIKDRKLNREMTEEIIKKIVKKKLWSYFWVYYIKIIEVYSVLMNSLDNYKLKKYQKLRKQVNFLLIIIAALFFFKIVNDSQRY